jgi:hypothetical protein
MKNIDENWCGKLLIYSHDKVFFLSLFGIALVILSLLSGSLDVSCLISGTNKQVGYLYAPNWSITTILIWPLMFFFLTKIIKEAGDIFSEINKSPMTNLYDEETNAASLEMTWFLHLKRVTKIIPFLFVIALLFSMYEWNKYSFSAYGTDLNSWIKKGKEVDWAVGFLCDASVYSMNLTVILSFLAYLYQSIIITIMISYFLVVSAVAKTIYSHASGESFPHLLIDISSNDPHYRMGFERFSILIEYMVAFIFLAYMNFYFTRIQNAYLNAHGTNKDLIYFLKEGLLQKISWENFGDLFVTGWSLDYSSIMVSIGAIVLFLFCFFIFNVVLRYSAILSLARTNKLLINSQFIKTCAAYSIKADQIRPFLSKMNIWPMGYSDVLPTLRILTLSLICIIFYRLGLYLVLIWVLSSLIFGGKKNLLK